MEKNKVKVVKKATTPAIPVLYKSEQHDELKTKADSNKSYYFFIRYPESTCASGESPLVKSFSAQMDLTGDTITAGDIIKDTLTLYRNSSVKRKSRITSSSNSIR